MTDPTAELIIEPWLYIDGRWVPGSGDDLDVENPATGEITGTVTQAAAGDVEAAAKYIPGSRLGPLISAEQRKEVESFLEPGAGGEDAVVASTPLDLPRRGYWVSPTVVSRVDPNSRLAQEEVFGPVLSILAADSDDDAVEIANNSSYGLGGAVWGGDEAALAVAGRIRAGQVDVNGAAFNPSAPFGGYKQSGIGREMGEYGIADVCEIKAVQR